MSLINDALKDLDSRSEESNFNADEHLQLEQNMSEAGAARRSTTAWLNWRSIVMPSVLLLGAFFVFDFRGHEDKVPSGGSESVGVVESRNVSSVNRNMSNVKSSAEISVHSDLGSGVIASDESSFGSENTVSPTLERLVTRDDKIRVYLDKADVAIKRNRLSVPAKGNALFFLAKVRELDPENSRAGAMYRDIQSSYLNQINLALENHHFHRAEKLISRSGVFGFNELEMESYQSRLSQKIELNRVAGDSMAERDIAEGNILPASVAMSSKGELDPEYKAADILSEAPLPIDNREKKRWVTATSESEDLHYVNQIKVRINSGEEKQAIAELAGRVKQNTKVLNSEIFLFDYYIGHSEFDKAQNLLNSLDSNHVAADYFNAQLTHHFHGPARAISILESSAFVDETRTAVLNRHLGEKQSAFLAALYQKAEEYKKAQAIYARLLREDQHNIQYTLGFALAADADGDRFSALTAYRKISASGYQNESVLGFVKKRISILEANDLAEATRW
ncbi:MAG: hypothetical protein K6L81_00115 [Agarilytica sp.]